MQFSTHRIADPKEALLLAFQHMIPSLVLLNERAGRKLGLSAVDMQALHLIALDDALLTPSGLAARMEMPPSTVTRVLDRLEARGFIRRVANGTDRRSICIERITPAIASVKSEFDVFAADMTVMVDRFDRAEQATIARFLDELRTLL